MIMARKLVYVGDRLGCIVCFNVIEYLFNVSCISKKFLGIVLDFWLNIN